MGRDAAGGERGHLQGGDLVVSKLHSKWQQS